MRAGTEEGVRVEDLPLGWYRRGQYRPRLRQGESDAWFLLDRAFEPVTRIPEGLPREPIEGREDLRWAFEDTYRRWNLPHTPDSERSIAALSLPGTSVIVAGQQPGFLGGPLHTLYKAIAAIAAARQYRALTGRQCVPVFWVAGEDHDFEEVRTARFPGPGDTEISFRLPHQGDRRPVSDYPIDAGAEAVLDAAIAHLAPRREGAAARKLVDAYRGRNVASGFAALLATLLGHTGLVLLDPVALRPAALPIIRRALERPEELLACIEKGRREVKTRGLEPFVSPRLPLFLIRDGQRQHLSIAPGGLEVEGEGRTIERSALLKMLIERPESFSAGALLRPIVQMATLPCLLTVGGPAEIGYFAQLGPLAEYFDVPRPRIALRLNATMVDGKPARTAAEIPRERLATARSPEELVSPEEEPPSLAAVRSLVPAVEAALLAAVRDLPRNADAGRAETRALALRDDMVRLTERIAKAHVGRRADELQATRRLWAFMFPDDDLQERRWNVLHFVARHGAAWVDAVLEAIEPAPLKLVHRWISFRAEGAPDPGED